MSNNNNKEVVPPKLSQSNEAAQRAFRARSRAIKKGIRQGRVEKVLARLARHENPQVPRTSQRVESMHHFDKAYIIKAHGAMLPERFTLPSDKHVVYLTPPTCKALAIPKATFMGNRNTVRKVLDPMTTYINSDEGKQYIHHILPGESTQDHMLTFDHDHGLRGVYKLPLHPNVFLMSAAKSLNGVNHSAALRVQASAERHQVKPEAYPRFRYQMKLSELLKKLGPGTYVVGACRGIPSSGGGDSAESSNGRRATSNTIPPEYMNEVRNFDTKAKVPVTSLNRYGTTQLNTNNWLNQQSVKDLAKRFENVRKRVEAQEYIPSRSAVSLLIRNNLHLASLAKNGKLQNYNHKTGKHT